MGVRRTRNEKVIGFSGDDKDPVVLLGQLAHALAAEDLEPSILHVSICYDGNDGIDYLLSATAINPHRAG